MDIAVKKNGYINLDVKRIWIDTEATSCGVKVTEPTINPVVGFELLASGAWQGRGVLGPEAFDPVPFLDLLKEYGSPWGMEERTPR